MNATAMWKANGIEHNPYAAVASIGGNELAWAAGVMDTLGTFSHKGATRAPTYIIRTRKYKEAAHRLAKLVGVESWVDYGGSVNMAIQGKRLEILMKKAWPLITRQRQEDYIYVVSSR